MSLQVIVNSSQSLDHFRSSSVYDDLALAAVWLYKATSDAKFLGDAVDHLQVGFGQRRCSLRGRFPVKLHRAGNVD
jgi:hypothetical protein